MNLIVNFIPDNLQRAEALEGGKMTSRQEEYVKSFSNMVNAFIFRPYVSYKKNMTPEMEYLVNSNCPRCIMPHQNDITIKDVSDDKIEVDIITSASVISKHCINDRLELEVRVKDILSVKLVEAIKDKVYHIEKIFR